MTWVDGTVVCAACQHARDVPPIALRVAHLAFSDLRRPGFTPNIKQGKTLFYANT